MDATRHHSFSDGGLLQPSQINQHNSHRERHPSPGGTPSRSSRRSLDSMDRPRNLGFTRLGRSQGHSCSDGGSIRHSLDSGRPLIYSEHYRQAGYPGKGSERSSNGILPNINAAPLADMYSTLKEDGREGARYPRGEAAFNSIYPPTLEDAVNRFVRPEHSQNGLHPTPHDQAQSGLHSLRYQSRLGNSTAGAVDSHGAPSQLKSGVLPWAEQRSSSVQVSGASADQWNRNLQTPQVGRVDTAGHGAKRTSSGPGNLSAALSSKDFRQPSRGGANDGKAWRSFRDSASNNTNGSLRGDEGHQQGRRGPDGKQGEQLADATNDAYPCSDHKALNKSVFETWMKLHNRMEEEDEKRRHKHLGISFVPHTGRRNGQLTYGKDHVLVGEAFIGNHPLKGEVLDVHYVRRHLEAFNEAFEKLYSMVEGAVAWEVLQYFGYLFHHVYLLAEKSAESVAGAFKDYEDMHAAKMAEERKQEKMAEKMEGVSHKLSDRIIMLESELNKSREQVVGLKEQLHAMKLLTSGGEGTESQLSRIETLQRQYHKLQEESAAQAEENRRLTADLEASRKAVRALRSDVTREHNLLQLVEDVLPGKSSMCAQKLDRFNMVLSKQQMEILVQAINLGNDPKELYAMMMERSVSGEDLHPFMSLMGELRETFDDIHVKAEWGEGFHKGDVCKIDDRPLTKGYLTQLIRNSDAKELRARLGDSRVERISLAFNRGLPASTLVQLLDGRMSKKGTCMLSNRLLLGALREHEEFDLEGRSLAALKDASASCSLTTIIGLQSDKEALEVKVRAMQAKIEELEDAIRVRDFKFGKVIGMDVAVAEDEDDAGAEPWCASDVTKLDEFLARDSADGFRALGTGPTVPKFLRAEGMIAKREMTKRETEDLISDIWASKEVDDHQKRHPLGLQEFVARFLQARFHEDAVKMGYNLLHHAHKYRHDPDCDIFLQVLDGRVSQDIYAEFTTVMDRLKSFMYMLDFDMHPSGMTGTLRAVDVKALLQCFFADKPNATIEALCAAFEKDLAEHKLDQQAVHYSDLFESDDNADQGYFATVLKQQHLKERMRLLNSIQEGLVKVCKEENISSVSSRQLAQVLKGLPMKMTKELVDNFLELGLGASWSTGVSDTVINVMKGIRRGRKGGFFRKMSNAQIVEVMNNTRESLGMLPKEEKAILQRMKEMMLKVDAAQGSRYRKELPDTDQMHTLMSRSLTKMAAFLGKTNKAMPLNQRSSS